MKHKKPRPGWDGQGAASHTYICWDGRSKLPRQPFCSLPRYGLGAACCSPSVCSAACSGVSQRVTVREGEKEKGEVRGTLVQTYATYRFGCVDRALQAQTVDERGPFLGTFSQWEDDAWVPDRLAVGKHVGRTIVENGNEKVSDRWTDGRSDPDERCRSDVRGLAVWRCRRQEIGLRADGVRLQLDLTALDPHLARLRSGRSNSPGPAPPLVSNVCQRSKRRAN